MGRNRGHSSRMLPDTLQVGLLKVSGQWDLEKPALSLHKTGGFEAQICVPNSPSPSISMSCRHIHAFVIQSLLLSISIFDGEQKGGVPKYHHITIYM